MTTVRLTSSSPVGSTSRILSRRISGITEERRLITSLFCTYFTSSSAISSIVSILPSGIAYFSLPTSTISVWIIARVSGRRIIKLLPSPSVVRISMLPPNASILVFTTSSPTPRPETSEITSAVEKLGRNKRSMISLSLIISACSSVIVPFVIAFCFTFSTLMPAPSSRTSITTLLPSW